VFFTDLKNILQYCNKGNLQQNTHFKFYIHAWYLIVIQAENTPSRTTVDMNITPQNPTLVTQFEMNAKHIKIRSDRVFNMSSTSFHTRSSTKNMTSTADVGKQRSSFSFVRVWCNAQFVTVSSCARHFFKHFNFKF